MDAPANSILAGPITYLSPMLCLLIKSPFTCQRETETKRLMGSKFRTFSTDIVAVEWFKETSEWMDAGESYRTERTRKRTVGLNEDSFETN